MAHRVESRTRGESVTFDDLWAIYRKRNPALQKQDGNVTMTVANLRRLARQAYDQGAKEYSGADPDDDEPADVARFVKDILSGRRQ